MASTATPETLTPTTPWDGKSGPYRPADPLPLSDRVRLHRGADVDLDPITFEVLSTKIWNINEEHADTIQRVSGSPIVVECYDFNTSITTEMGESVLLGPYVQYFGAAAEYHVKYTLENRGDSPGIRPGDVFVCNDALIAGSHAMDVGIYAPVFVGEELFAWVFNAAHARDIGGTEPGGLNMDGRDIYSDAPMLRAVRIADADGMRTEIEDTFMRNSRLPNLLALELRSQIVGVNRARKRVEELVDSYGADTVKATMRKLIDDTARTAARRLERVPDGRWTDVTYAGGAFAGDRDVHKIVLTMEKRGTELYFSNAGTDPQLGTLNCGFAQWRSSIGHALVLMLAYDHRFCIAGALRCAHFESESGTITTIDRDGSVATLLGALNTMSQAERLLGKMLFPDVDLRRSAVAGSNQTAPGYILHFGLDQHGQEFFTAALDASAGGVGAFPFRDGIDQGGATFWPKSEIAECETIEQSLPVLYLYRRAALNCGHGKYRGGNGVAFAMAGHRTEQQLYTVMNMAPATPTNAGMCGGHWASSTAFHAVDGSDLVERFAGGELPADEAEIRELGGAQLDLPARAANRSFLSGDVIEATLFGGGGFGDPIDREPEAVAADVRDGLVRPELAASVYAVALDRELHVDVEATERLRGETREDRLDNAAIRPQFDPTARVEPRLMLADRLGAAIHDGETVFCCASCDVVLGPIDENYKTRAARIDGSLPEVDPKTFSNPQRDIDAPVVYSLYACPACGTALDRELRLADDQPVWDIKPDPDSVTAAIRAAD